jgi:3-dehydroquinate dehydratase
VRTLQDGIITTIVRNNGANFATGLLTFQDRLTGIQAQDGEVYISYFHYASHLRRHSKVSGCAEGEVRFVMFLWELQHGAGV